MTAPNEDSGAPVAPESGGPTAEVTVTAGAPEGAALPGDDADSPSAEAATDALEGEGDAAASTPELAPKVELRPTEEAPAVESVTFARLIMTLAEGVDELDEGFARTLARTLQERAAHIRLPTIERVGLSDVIATLYMDHDMRFVVTGDHSDSHGAFSVRWDERDFPFIDVDLHRDPVDDPYTFATLDFSVRGRRATLLADADPFEAGQVVSVRALATIGERVEYRVTFRGQDASVAPEDLNLL